VTYYFDEVNEVKINEVYKGILSPQVEIEFVGVPPQMRPLIFRKKPPI
jgi:hypothetical protein